MWDLIVSVPDHCLSFYSSVCVEGDPNSSEGLYASSGITLGSKGYMPVALKPALTLAGVIPTAQAFERIL